MKPVPNYTIDEDVKRIDLFDQRFYQIEDKDLFNVTGWLEAFPKGQGYKEFLKNNKDPDAIRDEAAQLGSKTHKLIELTLSGEKVKWFDVDEMPVWERYLSWCNFWYDLKENPNETLKIKKFIKKIDYMPKFTEYIVWDLEMETAGTIDKKIKVIYEDDTFDFVILDWKSGNNIYDTGYIQVATYIEIDSKMSKIAKGNYLGRIIQTNPTLNKQGYRVYEVDPEDVEYFYTTKKNYLRAFGKPKPKYRVYPTEVTLDTIKPVEVK